MTVNSNMSRPVNSTVRIDPHNSRRPNIVIVIVNYNSADLVIQCVRSLQLVSQELDEQSVVELMIVDGGSSDRSADRLESHLDELQVGTGTQLLRLNKNGGFAYANNAAIRRRLSGSGDAAPAFFWLLNPDTIVQPGALSGLLAIAEQNSQAGIIGSKLLYANERFQHSAFRFPSPWTELQGGLQLGLLDRVLPQGLVPMPEHSKPHPADWVSGASFLVRHSVIESVGLLDDRFFLYFEEVEFCYRARQHGWEVWWTPDSCVIHLLGQTSGVDTSGRGPAKLSRRPAYWFHSRARYFATTRSFFGRLLADLGWLAGHLLLRLRTGLSRQPSRLEPYLISDFIRSTYFGGAKQ